MSDRVTMAQYVQGRNTAFADLNARVVGCVANDDAVAAEIEFTGTNTGPLQMGPGPAMPPTGRRVVGQGTFFGRVQDGKFIELRTYRGGMMIQLGMGGGT